MGLLFDTINIPVGKKKGMTSVKGGGRMYRHNRDFLSKVRCELDAVHYMLFYVISRAVRAMTMPRLPMSHPCAAAQDGLARYNTAHSAGCRPDPFLARRRKGRPRTLYERARSAHGALARRVPSPRCVCLRVTSDVKSGGTPGRRERPPATVRVGIRAGVDRGRQLSGFPTPGLWCQPGARQLAARLRERGAAHDATSNRAQLSASRIDAAEPP